MSSESFCHATCACPRFADLCAKPNKSQFESLRTGLLIGSQGANIKQLRRESGAKAGEPRTERTEKHIEIMMLGTLAVDDGF